MKSADKKVMKEIAKHRDLEMNIPAYGNAYMNASYEYSLLRLVLNYYTMKEVEDEGGSIANDEFLLETMDQIHTILYQTLLSDGLNEEYEQFVEQIHKIRQDVTQKMKVLTAYTDALQLYEYILNRVEFGITGEDYPVEESELAAKVFQYLFRDNDKMVVNSKIQLVTGQLPVRMTKNRFFEYLTDTLNIYQGSDTSSVDDFVSMLKSTALLELPQGYGEDYPEIYRVIDLLAHTEFKTLDIEQYRAIMEQFSFTTDHLTQIVSNHLLAMEIINATYGALLAMPYENSEENGVKVCLSMLSGLHDAFVSSGPIPESVDEGFAEIEGLQEMIGEDMLQFESILQDVLTEHKDTISWIMAEKIFNRLALIAQLQSNSLFIELEKEEQETRPADNAYIAAKRDELVALLTTYFSEHTKEMNRAVMAALFSNMPVLFNSQQEIKEYIEYSLNHCGNASELMACAKILTKMMEEE